MSEAELDALKGTQTKNKRHCSNQNDIVWMQPDLVYSHHVIP